MMGHQFPLWDTAVKLPELEELEAIKDVQVHVIKNSTPEIDGYHFLHGVIVAKHQGVLYSCWAGNCGVENTETEVVLGSYSLDDGKSWSQATTWIESHKGEGVSHGAFLSKKDKLWGFFPHFTGLRENVQMYLYQQEGNNEWKKICKITDQPFWPLGEPQQMLNGNYIMPGVYVGGVWGSTQNPAAVAISNGDDMRKWRIIKVPKVEEMVIWGESGVIIEGNRITCIMRCWHSDPVACVSISEDFGESWSLTERSNLAMTDSKPSTGRLSNAMRYLIGTTVANNGYSRYPLTLALGSSDDECFHSIRYIRNYNQAMDRTMNEGEQMLLAYPYATEANGKLYVTYSVAIVEKRIHNDSNYAEIAIIDIGKL